MTYERLNPPFEIPFGELERRLGVNIFDKTCKYEIVIPLRNIRETARIELLDDYSLNVLLRGIPLRTNNDSPACFPYEGAKICVFEREPKSLMIGQRFIVKSVLMAMMDTLSTTSKVGVFRGYPINGFSKMPPAKIFGKDYRGRKGIAFYIPPLVEIRSHHAVLLDGVHRNFICATAGTTINAVHVYSTDDFTIPPLPFEPISWHEIEMSDDRPTVEKRYKNLRREFFRDLSFVGIDG